MNSRHLGNDQIVSRELINVKPRNQHNYINCRSAGVPIKVPRVISYIALLTQRGHNLRDLDQLYVIIAV